MSLEEQLNMERRIATLEANYLHTTEALERNERSNLAVTEAVQHLTTQFAKYETRWGWITMFATAIGGAILILKDYVIDFFVGSSK